MGLDYGFANAAGAALLAKREDREDRLRIFISAGGAGYCLLTARKPLHA